MKNLAEVCFVVLGNYVRCLVIVVISVGLGEAKRCGGDFNVIILRWERKGASHKEGTSFMGGELTPLYTMKGLLTM